MIDRINALVASAAGLTRSGLSRQVCQWLGWQDHQGRPREVSARVALLRLARDRVVRLPAARTRPQAQPVTEPVAAAVFEGRLSALGPVEWVPVPRGDRRLSRVWRGLMEQHHPLGSGPLCGAQLRYLLRSPVYGWLGGAAFSAPALSLRARDAFIGWDAATRQTQRSRVVCNSRFLIVPTVRVPHLASHALSRCLRRLPSDWAVTYGQTPVLMETYVDLSRYRGTCYRAANWQMVGHTQGRGRNDRTHARPRTPKAVYLYPLRPDWRAQLGGRVPADPPTTDWACEEFATARLGDARLESRLVTMARDFYARPQAALPEACGSRAKTKAAYRFFDHPRVTMQTLLEPHYQATSRRCRGESVILAVQDSSSLNYSAHPMTEGLGPLNTRADGSIGLWMHDTLALTPAGVPLGLIDVQCWARDPDRHGQAALRAERALEDKESYKWLTSFAAANALQRQHPSSQVVSVGDREADLYELFVAALADRDHAKVLVRAERTRRITREHGALWDFMATQAVAGIQQIGLPRRGAVKARMAELEVRHAVVEIKPPKRKPDLPDLRLWAVLAREAHPPEGATPLEWMLLTSVPVDSFEDACERLRWYATRWQIEVYHRTLKSGCKIEARQLGSADRLQACLAIDLVVAWRVLYLTKLGRDVPELPCSVCFEADQWKALVAYHTQNPDPPETEPSLREATRMVAALGGFLGRKGDGHPGTKSLWVGLQRLDDLTGMYRVLTRSRAPPRVE